MPKQYNSEIEKELHLLRNSVGTINNKIDKIIAAFDLLLAESIKRQEEVKKNEKKYKPLEPDENLMREKMRQEGANAKKGST